MQSFVLQKTVNISQSDLLFLWAEVLVVESETSPTACEAVNAAAEENNLFAWWEWGTN